MLDASLHVGDPHHITHVVGLLLTSYITNVLAEMQFMHKKDSKVFNTVYIESNCFMKDVFNSQRITFSPEGNDLFYQH
jgi:hypothetical protein